MKFKAFLNERKQVGLIYHFTTVSGLKEILAQDKIIGSGRGEKNEIGVSTTRNKNLNFNEIRITLDGDKLSDKYKIKPYDYWYREYNVPYNPQTVDEDEEFVFTPKGAIFDIKKYIIEVKEVKKRENS